jgi:SAM-dependent methyltransferase
VNDPYREFGQGYAHRRQPDPRIAHHLETALGNAKSVVNVGAGTGSYEPVGRKVIAVEPSRVMIEQRAPGSAPVIQAFAEHLPFADASFDAGLAILTVHHWADTARGLAELRRVSRRQVILTWDQPVMAQFWLISDYLPEIAQTEKDLAAFSAIRDELRRQGARVAVTKVEVPGDCRDGFLAAYWRRPESYLDPTVRSAISSLAKLDETRMGSAMTRLADDLATGRWQARHGALCAAESLDLGYRLIIAEAEPDPRGLSTPG